MNADFRAPWPLLQQEKESPSAGGCRPRHLAGAFEPYENGVREPGLAFVKKACDYYHVSADICSAARSSATAA